MESGSSLTETNLRDAIAKLQHDNPGNPRYMKIAPKQMALLREKWNELEPLPRQPEFGTIFSLVEQEERKWQSVLSQLYI
jgi:hypothetical protein